MNLTKPHLGYMTSSRGRPRTGEHSGCGECTTRRAGAGTGTKDCEFFMDGYMMVCKEYMCNISIENHQQHYQYEQGHLFSISIS